jgi:hypothetical protein
VSLRFLRAILQRRGTSHHGRSFKKLCRDLFLGCLLEGVLGGIWNLFRVYNDYNMMCKSLGRHAGIPTGALETSASCIEYLNLGLLVYYVFLGECPPISGTVRRIEESTEDTQQEASHVDALFDLGTSHSLRIGLGIPLGERS